MDDIRMDDVRKDDGTSFKSKAALASVLKGQGKKDSYDLVEKDGGWVGVFNPKKKAQLEAEAKAKEEAKAIAKNLIKCKVYRSNIDPDNKDNPIQVTANVISNKRVFWPGEEVSLTQTHINILRDSVEETRIPIPAESGIYASKDPVAVAKNFYPSMTAEISQMDGTITMVSKIPNYIIEMT